MKAVLGFVFAGDGNGGDLINEETDGRLQRRLMPMRTRAWIMKIEAELIRRSKLVRC